MRVIKIILSAFALLSFASAHATTDLWHIYQLAKQNDQSFVIAQQNWLAERETSAIASAGLLPKIDGSVAVTGSNQYYESNGPMTYTAQTFNLGLRQPLISVKAIQSFKAARAKVRAAEIIFYSQQQALILRTAKAYFDILLAQENLRLLHAELRANGKRLEEARQRYEVGLDPITSVHEAQASFDSIKANSIAAENDVLNKFESLSILTGQSISKISRLSRPVERIKPNPENIDCWLDSARNNNLSVIAAYFSSLAARHNINANIADHLPSLNFMTQYNYTHRGAMNTLSFNTVTNSLNRQMGLELAIPIFQGAKVTSEVRRATHTYQASLAEYEKAKREARTQTHLHFNNVLSGLSKLSADRQAIISNRSSFESVLAAYNVGTRTLVDVLLAQSNLYHARQEYARDQYQFLLETLALKQAAGILNEQDMMMINSLLSGKRV